MKRKIYIVIAIAFALTCLFAISSNAAILEKYCDAKITLTSGEEVTAYFKMGAWGGSPSVERDKIYKSLNTDDGVYDWSTVKVLDMRDCNYTEGCAPEYMHGTECNKYASNVTTIYFPPTLKCILHTSFTSNWSSLDTVYIPKSLTTINYSAFYGSAVRTVVIEEGSELKTIGDGAFRECKNLETINLPEGLEKISTCAFYITSLNGKIVVPNSVTHVGDAAFRNTKIETLVLGDGPIYLGYNLAGNEGNTNVTYLKEIFIPANATFSTNSSQIWFVTKNATIDFYVIGSEGEDVSEFITTLRGTGRVKFATEEEIENGTTKDYNAIIKLGYNKCDAFYEGSHSYLEEAELNFTDFSTSFTEETYCTACNIREQIGEEYLPIFYLFGYSFKENGTAMCADYIINKDSLEKYYEYNSEIKYGMIASVPEADEALDILTIKDGEVSVNGDYRAIVAPISDEYASVQFILRGFNDNLLSLNVVMCLYVFDGENILYVTRTVDKKPDVITLNEIIESEKLS